MFVDSIAWPHKLLGACGPPWWSRNSMSCLVQSLYLSFPARVLSCGCRINGSGSNPGRDGKKECRKNKNRPRFPVRSFIGGVSLLYREHAYLRKCDYGSEDVERAKQGPRVSTLPCTNITYAAHVYHWWFFANTAHVLHPDGKKRRYCVDDSPPLHRQPRGKSEVRAKWLATGNRFCHATTLRELLRLGELSSVRTWVCGPHSDPFGVLVDNQWRKLYSGRC